MIFQYSYEKVLDGSKTQTRRCVDDGDEGVLWNDTITWMVRRGRTKWCVDGVYAVQPGRAKKAVGRIRVTAIRKEQLLDISDADANAEGFKTHEEFHETWNTVHTKHGRRWEDNPLVWVLEFELVE